MPKRVLFIISNMETGGVSKAMTSLLAVLDRKRVTPELLIVSPQGALMPLIPKDVRIYTDRRMAALTGGIGGIGRLIRYGRIDLAVMSAVRMALMRVSRSAGARLLARLMPRLRGHWDAVVDFNGQHQLYYMVRKIDAPRRATFFHNDYRRWRYYESADRRYFGRVDAIFTVSDVCVEALHEVFPEYADRIAKVENVSAPDIIRRMAVQDVAMPPLSGTVLMTLGHICHREGADLIVDAARRLHDAGVDFTWLMVGAPAEQEYVRQMLAPPLDTHFRLVGVTANPYPYLRRADIVVHPSRFEGKSIALDEARLMGKAVVVTDFSTVGDQFADGVNATIVPMEGAAVADAIRRLIDRPDIADTFRRYNAEHPADQSHVLDPLYAFIDPTATPPSESSD